MICSSNFWFIPWLLLCLQQPGSLLIDLFPGCCCVYNNQEIILIIIIIIIDIEEKEENCTSIF